MYIKPWITLGGLAAVLGLGGCQTLSNTTEKVSDQVTGLFSSKDKAPKIDKDGVVDISKKNPGATGKIYCQHAHSTMGLY